MNFQSNPAATELAGRIDHTQLKCEAGRVAIEQLCGEAGAYGFASVCVHPCHVRYAAELLKGQASRVGSVVGFPWGVNHTQVKRAEAAQAIADGASELDMVVNLPAVFDANWAYVRRDVAEVLCECRRGEQAVTLKVILETAALDQATKVTLCELLGEVGVDYLKTSTGLHGAGGATVEDVALLDGHRGPCKVKAAGGIRDLATAQAMLQAGADRLGTSSGVAIVQAVVKS